MRGSWFLIAVLLAATSLASAAPLYPAGAQALEARLLAKMGRGARAWIQTEARREVNIGYFSVDTQNEAALHYGAPAANFPALSFLVLMQAARDADADVHAAVDSRNMGATQVAREEQLANGINKYNVQSELSPGSDIAVQQATAPTLLSSKFKTPDPSTAGTTHPNDVAAPPPPPPKPADMQKVMDRESDIEDTLAQAAKAMSPAAETATQPMG
jgi:hypothetical protein